MTVRRVCLLAGLGVALAAAGCHQDKLVTPLPPQYAGGTMFQRYVSFGNSITAGFQSFGLSDSLQQLAYPVLLARAMGTPFSYPTLNNPGCPIALASSTGYASCWRESLKPKDWKPAVMLLPKDTYRWNIVPPAYCGGSGVTSLS